jgi:hypothetical protein
MAPAVIRALRLRRKRRAFRAGGVNAAADDGGLGETRPTAVVPCGAFSVPQLGEVSATG